MLERSFKAASKLKHALLTDLEMENIPFTELSYLAEDIKAKTHHKKLILIWEIN